MKIPVSIPYLSNSDKAKLIETVESGFISGVAGKNISLFEEEFAKFCGTKYAVSCSNGTTAIHLALLAAGVKKGDEVLVADLTNMATFFAVEYIGAIPIPVDVDPVFYTMDCQDILAKITPKTTAILCVHLFGQLCDMEKICKIANENNLKIIEDCAEAHGAEYNNKKAGSFGDFGAFSFFANKLLTCGEGGIVTTNDEAAADRMKSLKALAFGSDNKFLHEETGFNYRLTNLQSALGLSQVLNGDEIIQKRIDVCNSYLEQLNELSDYFVFPQGRPDYKNVFWMFHIRVTGILKGRREEVRGFLKENGIETREGFIPYTMQTYHGRSFDANDCPNSKMVAEETFYLPTFNDISNEEISYICEKIRFFVENI